MMIRRVAAGVLASALMFSTAVPASALEPAEITRGRDNLINGLTKLGCPALGAWAFTLRVNFRDMSASGLSRAVYERLVAERSTGIAQGDSTWGGRTFEQLGPADQDAVMHMSADAVGVRLSQCLAPLRDAGSTGF